MTFIVMELVCRVWKTIKCLFRWILSEKCICNISTLKKVQWLLKLKKTISGLLLFLVQIERKNNVLLNYNIKRFLLYKKDECDFRFADNVVPHGEYNSHNYVCSSHSRTSLSH